MSTSSQAAPNTRGIRYAAAAVAALTAVVYLLIGLQVLILGDEPGDSNFRVCRGRGVCARRVHDSALRPPHPLDYWGSDTSVRDFHVLQHRTSAHAELRILGTVPSHSTGDPAGHARVLGAAFTVSSKTHELTGFTLQRNRFTRFPNRFQRLKSDGAVQRRSRRIIGLDAMCNIRGVHPRCTHLPQPVEHQSLG